MDFSPVQLVSFILVFVPGYIFTSICDYHLLKGEISQFEKTIKVLLFSTVIWVLVLVIPYIPFISEKKEVIISYLIKSVGSSVSYNDMELNNVIQVSLHIYIAVCIYTFIIGNIWGLLRRFWLVEAFFRLITGRDRYKTVSLRFYTEQLGSTIAATCNDGKRYIGILAVAPDDASDNSIIISKPSLVEDKNLKDYLQHRCC